MSIVAVFKYTLLKKTLYLKAVNLDNCTYKLYQMQDISLLIIISSGFFVGVSRPSVTGS